MPSTASTSGYVSLSVEAVKENYKSALNISEFPVMIERHSLVQRLEIVYTPWTQFGRLFYIQMYVRDICTFIHTHN